MVDVAEAAGEAATVLDQIQKIEPWVATFLPMVVPEAGPVIPAIQAFEPMIMAFASRALHDIAANNNGDIMGAMIELFQHLTKGQPNSPVLSPVPIAGPVGA